MKQPIHEGILSQDKYKRYCLYELGVPEHKMLTCTSGCRLEVWLNRVWIGFPRRRRRERLLVIRRYRRKITLS